MFQLTHTQSTILKAVALAGSLIAASFLEPAHAGETVVRDRFSDEIVGSGPDLVFIPGLASSRDTWQGEVSRLNAHYRLHLIQVAGFAGEAARANASGPVLVPTAEAIDAYLVERHLVPAVVIGHSLGGTIALYLAEHHPDHLKKAMLVDALPFYATLMMGPQATVESMKPMADGIRSGASKMTPEQSERMMASMATRVSDKAAIAGWSKTSDPSVVANALADDLTLDMRPGLAGIPVPLTLVYPDYVPLGTPKGMTDGMYHGHYAAVPHMTFVRADNSLHFAMFDQPAQFDAALDAFLAQ
jgi:pimeloyl-[acyl-carrier protein] methyl ester esterase